MMMLTDVLMFHLRWQEEERRERERLRQEWVEMQEKIKSKELKNLTLFLTMF